MALTASGANRPADPGKTARLAPADRSGNGLGVVAVTGLASLQPFASRLRQAARDLFLVVATLALLGSQALSTLHYVLVPHHLCSVHGVLEDVTPGAQNERRTPERDDAVNADERDSDSHEACSVATRAEHGVLLERPTPAVTRLDDICVAERGAGVSLTRARAQLLSNAPKTSPPADS